MPSCTYHIHAYHVHTSRSPSTTNMHSIVYISYTRLPCTHFKVSLHFPIYMSACTYHVHTYPVHTSRSPSTCLYACHREHTMYTLTMYTLQGLPALAYMHVSVYVPYTHLKVTQHNQYACHRVHTMYTLTMYTLQGLTALANIHVSVYITCTHLPCTHFKVSQHLPICMSPCTLHAHTYHVHTSRSASTTNMHATVYILCTSLPCTHFKVSQHLPICMSTCTYHVHTCHVHT